MRYRRRNIVYAACLSAVISAATPPMHALAQVPILSAASPATDRALLAVELDRASAIRAAKTLQYAYTQFGEYGLWRDMAALFSREGELKIGDRTIKGADAIEAALRNDLGSGRDGLPAGSVNSQLMMAPVITVGADGTTARGRWQELTLRGRRGGEANWSGGMQVNDYVQEDGIWKIARMEVLPQFAGNYETGWFSLGPQIPFVPYHYTSAEAGHPVPELTEAQRAMLGAGSRETTLADLETRVGVMNDEDHIRNLQNIYGYYQDRKMWDDVTDLFATDGVLEIAGLGVYEGPTSIRRALELSGPAGLQRGQVNDQIQLHTVVSVDPNGVEARARGLQLGMLTPELGQAYWMISTFDNRYLKGADGKWRILEMRIYPRMKADYYQGWHRSSIVDPVPTGAAAPDRASPSGRSPQVANVIPAFFDNPVTGRPVSMPAGFDLVGHDRLTAASAAPILRPEIGSEMERLGEVRHRLDLSKAYDAVENISSTFGYYLDDYQWQRYVENYSVDGWRRKGNGSIYAGRDAIFKGESISYGPMPVLRDWIRVHTRLQPVIDVEPDGQRAFIRTRMFLYFANSRSPGSWNSGMYPNDQAVLEDGVWKMRVGGWIDETYFNSRSYALGWAKPDEPSEVRQEGGAPQNESGRRSPIDYPASIPADQLGRRGYGVIRGYPGFASWPEIKPMWFHYRNPVSGREPELFCEDVTVCVHESDPPAAPGLVTH